MASLCDDTDKVNIVYYMPPYIVSLISHMNDVRHLHEFKNYLNTLHKSKAKEKRAFILKQ